VTDIRPDTYQAAVTETKLSELRVALTETKGNIKQAALDLGLSRQQMTKLVKKYELGEFAAKLRLAGGEMKRLTDGGRKGVVTGRPRKR
jgi:DNA-binding NtrC family response regulator